MLKLNPSKKLGLFHHLLLAECRTKGFYLPTVILINLTDADFVLRLKLSVECNICEFYSLRKLFSSTLNSRVYIQLDNE